MSNQEAAPFVDAIFHLTDFTLPSERAFAHALAIALVRQGKLTILHVGEQYSAGNEWHRFPAARDTLNKWGILANGSSPSDIQKSAGIRMEKVDLVSGNIEKAAKEFLDFHPADLLVLATEEKAGLMKFLEGSIAEKLAEETHIKTLFVPNTAKPFICLNTGEVSLQKILVPVADDPDPIAAIEYASRVARFSLQTGEKAKITLLHTGSGFDFHDHLSYADASLDFQPIEMHGTPAEDILKVAKSDDMDMIIMATRGHHGFLDILRGSVTKEVLQRAPCPLLSVPNL